MSKVTFTRTWRFETDADGCYLKIQEIPGFEKIRIAIEQHDDDRNDERAVFMLHREWEAFASFLSESRWASDRPRISEPVPDSESNESKLLALLESIIAEAEAEIADGGKVPFSIDDATTVLARVRASRG